MLLAAQDFLHSLENCPLSSFNNMKDSFWLEESCGNSFVCNKRKRRVGKRKIEFVGWGSRPLIEFLEVIGQKTQEKHSRHAVAAFITKYINDKGLTRAEKKKKVLCDDILYALFGKKSMSRIKVYDMLEEHFAENHNDSDDLLDSSDDEDYYGEKSSFGLKNVPASQMKKVHRTPKSQFAAISLDNIKLIYLKRSVILELLKFPESFEFKIMGSFVRMKSDPDDIYQKNPFQLQQVTGVKWGSGAGDTGTEIHLSVSNIFSDISIDMLSDDNISKEEIEDLQDRIKAGLRKRLTFNELQLKAQVLHADITKHWISKEISLLQKLIEHANEKGWQRQKFEYIERRKMLQTPSEQEKLLLEVPEVIAEEVELEGTVAAASGEAEVNAFSPISILWGSSDVSSIDASGSGEILGPTPVVYSDLHAPKVQNGFIDGFVPLNNPKGSGEILGPTQVVYSDPHALKVQNGFIDDFVPLNNPKGSGEILGPTQVVYSDPHAPKVQNGFIDGFVPLNNPKDMNVGDRAAELIEREKLIANLMCDVSKGGIVLENSGEKDPQAQERLEKLPTTTTVIDLSDDDAENEDPRTADRDTGENVEDLIWHYLDPKGQVRGPFPLYLMKRWYESNYFHPGFVVWKNGQTADDGVLLVDVLRRNFPH